MSVKLIAELCQNHNGDFEIVKKMVDAAVENGASHVKIQHIHEQQDKPPMSVNTRLSERVRQSHPQQQWSSARD